MRANALQIGYARVNITPLESVPPASYGNTSFRMFNNVLSDLFSSCIAFTDADVCNIKPGTAERLAAMYVGMLKDLHETRE